MAELNEIIHQPVRLRIMAALIALEAGNEVDFALAGIMPTASTAQIVAMVLLYPMLILSGAAWPRELMHATVLKLSTFLPLTYVVNLLRGLWAGEPWGIHILDIGVLVGMLLLGIIVSVKTFRWE